MMVVMAATASSRSLPLLVMAVAAALALHRLALQVSALTCHEGVGWRSRVSDNSTLKLREGEVLVLHCSTDPQVYQDLTLGHCLVARIQANRDRNTLNYTWYCHVTGNISITLYGLPYNSSEQDATLLEFNVEIYNLVQCLADARATPGPCTTPSNGQIDVTAVDSRQNCTVRENSLVGVVCVLGVTVLVQLAISITGISCKKWCTGRRGTEVKETKGGEGERGVKMNAIQERGRRTRQPRSGAATGTVFTKVEAISSKFCKLF